jgi:Ser/Thr protein kinase RdoA (MazF antagonist)
MSVEAQLPSEIREGFFGDAEVTQRRLGGGEINQNFCVEADGGDKRVVQEVNAVVFKPHELAKDFESVSSHLSLQGWEAPHLIRGLDGKIHQKDLSGGLWRSMSFIESDAKPNTDMSNQAVMKKCGSMLARWHVSIALLDYEPQHKIEHFHDTKHYADTLEALIYKMPNEETQDFSSAVLASYNGLPELPDYGDQLLHGDPRTDNMLFRDGEPFTFIDLDTVMRGPVWIDLGDMLRSLGENAIKKGGEVPVDIIEVVAESYRQEAHPEAGMKEFRGWAFAAMKLITSELTMRFLNDIVEDRYFAWDKDNFASRADYVYDRAKTQWKITESLERQGV